MTKKLRCLCDDCNWDKLTENECLTADKEYRVDYGVVKCSAYKSPNKTEPLTTEWMPKNPCVDCWCTYQPDCYLSCQKRNMYLGEISALKTALEYQKGKVISQGRSLSYKQIESMLSQLEASK